MTLRHLKSGLAAALILCAGHAWSAGPECPEGFFDKGALCTKPAAYSRGAGYPWKPGDGVNDKSMMSRCQKAHPGGCELSGAVAYPKCGPGFKASGCCTCTPQCPSGFKDKGKSCAKPIPPA